MSYSAEISRGSPSCVLFLIDQSGSMDDPFGAAESGRRKADGLADAINRLLQTLVIKCAKSEGIRDYYHVGVIGYGERVGPAWLGSLSGRELVPISEVGDSPARVEERARREDDGAGGVVERSVKFPVWFDAVAANGTPMSAALQRASSILEPWIAGHQTSFPPIVINVTDGEATDGDPGGPAAALRLLSGDDGNVLLFNAHLSSQRSAPIEFPSHAEGLPDEFARRLFSMSSPLPPHMVQAARADGFSVSEDARGFVFNADMVSVIRFLDIGTRPSNLR